MEQMRELITGLSRQVFLIASHSRGSGEGSSGNSNHSLSRLAQVEFPKFLGQDVQGWIHKCDQFFEIDNVGEDMKVGIASIHLSERALQWHQSFMKSRPGGNWPLWADYKGAILSRFGAKPYDDPLAKLMKLRQVGTVEQY